jgi:hypothetical protein
MLICEIEGNAGATPAAGAAGATRDAPRASFAEIGKAVTTMPDARRLPVVEHTRLLVAGALRL